MRVTLQFVSGHPADLTAYLEGKTGEIVEMFSDQCLVRVELEGHTTRNPSTVLLLTEWKNIEVISG